MSRPTTTIDGKRHCVLCRKTKPLEEFYSRRGYKGRTYYSSYCKPCTRADTIRRNNDYRRERENRA